jgi:arachidonate 5-lipoxygenase
LQCPRTEEDILKLIPSKSITLDVMAITRLLSRKGTQKLGDFEVQYMYDPQYVRLVDE